MRYLGIDFGSKRIGLAVSDPDGKIAFPKEVVSNEGSKTLQYIAMFCEREKIEAIVLGESRDFKGKPNPIQSHIANFKLKIEAVAKLPVYYEAEHLTSSLASRSTLKDMLDAAAAALILQAYLDRL